MELNQPYGVLRGAVLGTLYPQGGRDRYDCPELKIIAASKFLHKLCAIRQAHGENSTAIHGVASFNVRNQCLHKSEVVDR